MSNKIEVDLIETISMSRLKEKLETWLEEHQFNCEIISTNVVNGNDGWFYALIMYSKPYDADD